MLSRNKAQRPSFEQAVPQMLQQLPRAQNAANGGMTSQPTRHLASAPTTATMVAGSTSTLYTSRFFIISSLPSPFSPTTHHSGQTWHQAAPITKDRAQPEGVAQQALHSHHKIDTKQAGSSSLQLGGESPPAASTPAVAWDTLQPNSAISRLEPGTPRMHRVAHNLSLGAVHEQTEPGLNPLPDTPLKIMSIGRRRPQSVTQAPEAPQLLDWTTAQQAPHFYNNHGNKQASSSSRQRGGESTPAAATHAAAYDTLQPAAITPRLEPETPRLCSAARNLPFGMRHEQAEPGLSPLPIISKKIKSDERKKLQAATKIPEARQFYNGHRTNAPTQLHSLAGNVLHPLGKGSELAGRNGPQLGEGTTHAAVLARLILQPASTAWSHRVPHTLRPAHEPTLETRHEQAHLVMDILAANTKQINLEARNKLQEITKAPEARFSLQGPEEQTSAQIYYLDGDSPLPPPFADYREPGEPEPLGKTPAGGARRHAQQINTTQRKGASIFCAMSGFRPRNQEAGAQPMATLVTESTLAKRCQDEAEPSSTPVNAPLDPQPPIPTVAHSSDDTVMYWPPRPSQTFVQDFTGRTHVVLFKSTDSIATNLLRYSDKLLLPPLEEIYILAGCRILRNEGTQLENNLSPDSPLSIMLRCKGGMQDGKKSRGRDRGGSRGPEVSSRTMGGGPTSLDINRPPPVRLEKGRGRGFRAEGRRTTVLHTQTLDDMDGFSRQALIEARQAASIAYTAKLCQERCSTNMDFGPPPEPASSPTVAPMAPGVQPKSIPPTAQDNPDHHYTAEDHRHVTWNEPLTEAGFKHVADTTSALQLDPPDLPNPVCSAPQEALNLPEPNTKAQLPQNMLGRPDQNPIGERLDSIAGGAEFDGMGRDSLSSEPIARTTPLHKDSLHQPAPPIDLEKWPRLPTQGDQDPLGPAAQPHVGPWKQRYDPQGTSPRVAPQTQTQQETAIQSAIQVTTSCKTLREAAVSVDHSTVKQPTLPRHLRKSTRPSKVDTACFRFDTKVLIVQEGFAMWEGIYKVCKGETVVQSLPSGNILDLTDAILTPVTTLCCFETTGGPMDMVCLGLSTITPHHHVLLDESWMTASQAMEKGLGTAHRSSLGRVYNLCLQGGGNILINTSTQPEESIFTPAATMGYLFTPAFGSQQHGSLSYPKEIQNQLGMRQDLRCGLVTFKPRTVKTLPNGALIFENTTGDIPLKKAYSTLRAKSLDVERLKQPATQPPNPLSTRQTRGTGLSSGEESSLAPLDISPPCSLLLNAMFSLTQSSLLLNMGGVPECATQDSSPLLSITAIPPQKREEATLGVYRLG